MRFVDAFLCIPRCPALLRLPSTHFGHSCFAETRAFFFGAAFMWRPAASGGQHICACVFVFERVGDLKNGEWLKVGGGEENGGGEGELEIAGAAHQGHEVTRSAARWSVSCPLAARQPLSRSRMAQAHRSSCERARSRSSPKQTHHGDPAPSQSRQSTPRTQNEGPCASSQR